MRDYAFFRIIDHRIIDHLLPNAMLRLLARFLICCLLLAALWLGGFAWFVSQIPQSPTQDTEKTDAIVVLTGGRGRIYYALSLLKAGYAPKLFISGVEGDLRLKTPPGKEIAFGTEARNTIGNAIETARWTRKEGVQSIRLVTTDYHMPRALMEFRQTMPEVAITPDPLISERGARSEWWRFGSADSRLILSEYHKTLAGWVRHRLIEWLEERA